MVWGSIVSEEIMKEPVAAHSVSNLRCKTLKEILVLSTMNQIMTAIL